MCDSIGYTVMETLRDSCDDKDGELMNTDLQQIHLPYR